MKFSKLSLAAVGLAMAGSAHASMWDITTGIDSTETGAIALSLTGGDFTGGAIETTSIADVALQPAGTTGSYWAVGPSTSGVVTLATPAIYYGFLWGSPDSYNTVQFYDGATLLASLTGTQVFGSNADGSNAAVPGGQYFNFFAGAGQLITSVDFFSTQPAFETDNHAVVDEETSVPEPGTLSLLGLSLLAFGFLRRKKRA